MEDKVEIERQAPRELELKAAMVAVLGNRPESEIHGPEKDPGYPHLPRIPNSSTYRP